MTMMRVLQTTAICVLLVLGSAAAFSIQSQTPASSRTISGYAPLDLFGGGGGGGEKKGPGFMDQLAMIKKAQEIAQKRGKIDEELKKMDFAGESSNGKVKASFKYVPATNPMDPNPDYEAVSFDFDDEFFGSASPEDLSEAVKECIMDGIENTNKGVSEKYAALQEDLAEALSAMKPKE